MLQPAQVPKREVTPKLHVQRNSLQRKPAAETGVLQQQPQLALPAPETAAAPEAGESVDRMAELVQQHLQNKRKEPSDKDGKPSKAAKAPKAAPKKKAEPKPKQADTATKAKSTTNKLPTKASTEARDPITLEKCFRVHMPEEPELAREVAWREKGQSLLLEVWNDRGMDPAQDICARLVARLDPPMSHILCRKCRGNARAMQKKKSRVGYAHKPK